MTASLPSVLLGMFLAFAMVGVGAFALATNGYRLIPKNLKLPFMDFDATRFKDLSAVQLFQNVSRAVIRPSDIADQWLLEKDGPGVAPILLVHVAWRIVSDAFCEKFLTYPSDENVQNQVSEIGAQNVEFVILYKKIFEAASKQSELIDLEFAKEVFVRAPSLAHRISGEDQYTTDQIFDRIAALLPDK
ncbi:MAG: hypothetical protein ACKOOL_06035 [Novosphingobium sp.]